MDSVLEVEAPPALPPPTAPRKVSRFCAVDHVRIVHTEDVCPMCSLRAASLQLISEVSNLRQTGAKLDELVALLEHRNRDLQLALGGRR